MDLKRDVIVRSHFTSIYHLSAHEGKTIGKFDESYISRPTATEPLILSIHSKPVSAELRLYEHSNYSIFDSPEYVQKRLTRDTVKGGRDFSRFSLSLTRDQMKKIARRQQYLYNQGHSVYKTILSLTTPYMKKMGLVSPNFKMTSRGESFGQVDQLKLRIAYQAALNRLLDAGKFRNPVWLAAPQFDTKHVHVHFTAVDDCPLSKSLRLVPSNRQGSDVPYWHREDRGKMWQREIHAFRSELQFKLEEMQPEQTFSLQPQLMKENIFSRTRAITQRRMGLSSDLQQIMACLPKNRNLWNCNNHSRLMQKPNYLMKYYVRSLISHHSNEIGYPDVVGMIDNKAHQYSKNSAGYTVPQMYNHGMSILHGRMMNSVYKSLKQAPKNIIYVRTPFMEESAYDSVDLLHLIRDAYRGKKLKNKRLTMFVYRLNSYQSRYLKHLRDYNFFYNSINYFDKRNAMGQVSPQAYPLRSHYFIEAKYNGKALDKYRFLLHINHADPDHMKALREKRKSLMRDYQFLKQSASKPVITEGPTPLAHALLHTKLYSLRDLLNNTNNGRTESFGNVIHKLINNPKLPVPGYVRYGLEGLEKGYPKYKGIVNELNNRAINVANNTVDPARKYFYADNLSRYTHEAFNARALSYWQVADFQQAVHHITAPPAPRKNCVSDDDFELVKGVDLQDCLCDIAPGQKRHISNHTGREFHQNVNQRSHALQGIQPYLIESGQLSNKNKHAKYLKHVLHAERSSLQYQQYLDNQIQQNSTLPTNFHIKQLASDYGQRNQVTFDIQTARYYTQYHLNDLRQNDRHFEDDLEHNPRQILVPQNSETPNADFADANESSNEIER